MSFRRLAWTVSLLAALMGGVAVGAARALPLDLDAVVLAAQSGARLEIRLAEPAPASGLKGTSVPGSNRQVYLHSATLATDADVMSARVVDMGDTSGLTCASALRHRPAYEQAHARHTRS